MLKTVTYEQALAMHPCWLDTQAGRRRLKRYSDRLGGKATALDILCLNRIPAVPAPQEAPRNPVPGGGEQEARPTATEQERPTPLADMWSVHTEE